MTSRREFVAVTAGAFLGVGAIGGSDKNQAGEPKTILMLGGTGFLGPQTVEAALRRGHTVTLFNRGKTRPGLFPNLEKLHGDRDKDDLRALEGRKWDAVVDTSANVPRWVKKAAAVLGPNVGHYIYVSSISVYSDLSKPGTDETAPVATIDDPTTEKIDARTYGALKALSEKASEAAMPGRVAVVRPGLIVGPEDPTDRYTYWPVRVARGGEVLAPGSPDDPIQLIDVRDLGAFLVRLIEDRTTGVFNALGPDKTLTMGRTLEACKEVTRSDATFTWADAEFLTTQGVHAWSDMPAWVPNGGETAGFARVSNARALKAGLAFHPIADTAKVTLDWFRTLPEERRSKLRRPVTRTRDESARGMEGQDRQVVKTRRDSTGDRERATGGRQGIGMDKTRRRRPLLVLRTLVAVRDDEIGSLLWACLFLFGLLAGNYLIRPIRDDMGIAGGTAYLPALFAGTLVAMLVVWPFLSARLGRQEGRPSCTPVFRGLQLSLAAFFIAFHLLPSTGQAWAARAFFVWASVSNLLVVSIAWGSLAGRFTSDQAHRLFGFIAAGGALGAISGSTLAGLLAMPMGPLSLMLPAAGCLELALLAARRLFQSSSRPDAGSNPLPAADSTQHDERPKRSFYLVGLGLWTLLFTISSAFIYMEQARIVEGSIRNPAARTAFFARIDLLVNLLSLALQVSVTGWALSLLGAGGSAAILPAVTLIGSIVLALRPTVATVQWFQVARRAVNYAIARPSREVFYTAVGRAELLRVKGLIDTTVYRAGDAAGAWFYGLLAALPGLSRAAPLAVVPLSLVWFVLSLGLGRALRRRLVHGERRGS